jgi:hypothetical protein
MVTRQPPRKSGKDLIGNIVDRDDFRLDVLLSQEIDEIGIAVLVPLRLEFLFELLDCDRIEAAFEEIELLVVVIDTVIVHGCAPLVQGSKFMV